MRSWRVVVAARLPVLVSAALVLMLVLSFAPATRADDPESPPHAPSFSEAPAIKRPMVGVSTSLTFQTTGPDVTTACQWQEGGTGSVGASWTNISGATSCSSHTPSSSLANAWLRAKVTATNAHGDVTTISAALRVNGELLVSSNVSSAWGWNLGLRLYDGSNFRRLTSGSTSSGLGDYEPTASEDGTLIAFSSKRTGSNGQDLYLTTPSGSPVVRLTDYPGDERARLRSRRTGTSSPTRTASARCAGSRCSTAWMSGCPRAAARPPGRSMVCGSRGCGSCRRRST